MDKADGEDLKLEVTIMDKDYRERIREEAGRETVPRRMFIRKEDVEEHGYTVRCPGCVSILRGTARQEHTEVCRRRLEKELGGTDRAKQARKKVDDYVEKKMAEDEEARKKRIDEKKMKNDNVDDNTAGEHGNVVEKWKRDDGDGDGEDERANDSTSKEPDGPNVVTSGPSSFSQKREAEDVSEEKTEKFLRKLDRREKKRKEREGGQDDEEGINEVRVAGHVVNEEVMEVTAEADQWGEIEDSEDELDPKQVTIGRQEELEFMVGRLSMFEFGSYEEAIQRGGKEPTTTKWVEGWKADDKGGRFVRCRLVGRDFKKKGTEEREDLFAAMPPLESKKLMFRMVAGAMGAEDEEKAGRG